MECKMLTKYEAIKIAKQKAFEYKLSWSDRNLSVKAGEMNNKPCFIVSTMDDGCDESGSWLDFQFSNPNVFYINSVDGAFLGYNIANRKHIFISDGKDSVE